MNATVLYHAGVVRCCDVCVMDDKIPVGGWCYAENFCKTEKKNSTNTTSLSRLWSVSSLPQFHTKVSFVVDHKVQEKSTLHESIKQTYDIS
jgi:hypothetical protein